MSGGLLVGIAAVGLGWVYVTKGATKVAPKVDEMKASGESPAVASDAAVVAAETCQSTNTVEAVKAAIDCESKAPVIGDVPVSGADGGQVLPVKMGGPEGESIMVIDPDKSTGGADPATQSTALHTQLPDDSPPAFWAGNSEDAILSTKYGISGARGITDQQAANAYRDAAVWSNEVF